ncbi:MAG: hypothetical protein JO142_01190 [Burkholderiales bacterium]|nr:hypothetical protein [Burkholderiales bacterium]
MITSSVGSAASSYLPLAAASGSERAERPGAPDHDGDSDDRGAAQSVTASTPTSNLNGQIVGQHINIKA